jgi:transcriptional regulator with XRE-family HTH domain
MKLRRQRRGLSRLASDRAIIQNPGRTTIKDVARAAGVSTATVSNVINNTGKFSRATKEKVRAAIQRINWEPNINARNLARTVD